jgi:hypothetical protein
MAEAAMSLVFLGFVFLAALVCLCAPVAAVGFKLWQWSKASESGKARKVGYGRL